MIANQSDVKALLDGAKQYILPLYQRRYSWRQSHWKTLSDDIDRLLQRPEQTSHFIGSFVSAPIGTAADQSVNRFRLIDGQQRLTTVVILLAALRDLAAERGQSNLAGKIAGQYLANQFEQGDAAKKLLLTEDDRPQLDAVLGNTGAASGAIADAFAYFAGHLRDSCTGDLTPVLQTIMGRLSVVNITLSADDDPHLIFESLNAKGEKLSPSDLLRNYFLMRLPQADADAHFRNLWEPMRKKIGEDLTPFFRHYLMRDADDGNVRKDQVYFRLKARVDHDAPTPMDVVASLKDIHRFGMYYATLAGGEASTDPAVAHLHRLRTTTPFPFLMNVKDAITDGRLGVDAFPATSRLIESFLVRRLICGVPSNQLRKIFLALCGEAARATDTAAFLSAVRHALSQGKRCPNDDEFRAAVINGSLYSGPVRDLSRYMLEQLERSYGSKEMPDVEAKAFQIEHVMPQTLTDAWRVELSPADPAAADAIQARWLHRLGNLTLTAYNPELSNRPFAEKKSELGAGALLLNRYFPDVAHWDEEAIQRRAEALAARVLSIWPDVATTRDGSVALPPVGRRAPTVPVNAVVISGQRYSVTTMVDAAHQVFNSMLALDVLRFEAAVLKVVPQNRRATTAEGMRAGRQVGDMYVDFHGSGAALRRRCRKLVHAMGLKRSNVHFEMDEPLDGDDAGRGSSV